MNTAAAEAAEKQLVNNSITRLLVEQRLASLRYNPGPRDGRFDSATREAILAFQRDAGIAASGFVDQATAARLLGLR